MLATDANFLPSLPGVLLTIEWGGALIAIVGALVMSLNRQWSWFAWPLWILSNLVLLVPMVQGAHWGMVVMQVAFLAVNVNGLLRYRRTSPTAPDKTSTSKVRGDGQ